jgi:hypothetical protein
MLICLWLISAFCWPCLPRRQGKDIVLRFMIEYSSSFRDFYSPLGNNNNRSILYMRIFFLKMIFWLVLKLEISYIVIIIS